MTRAEVLLPVALGLGEGATALSDHEFLVVDIHAGTIVSADMDGNSSRLHTFDHSVGAVAPTIDGGIVFAGAVGIGVVGSDAHIALVNPEPGIRMNDGKADPVGRFVGGTMAEPPRQGAGTLWSFQDGAPTALIDDVTISNGLCWSADGSRLFYVDTPTQRIDAFDYDLERGTVAGRRTVASIPTAVGSPDGLTIDSDGGLWVALWGGSAVHRYVDGDLDDVIEVGTPFVTSATFVSEHLVITTAAEPTVDDPLAGHVFVADVGITGPLPHAVDLRRTFGT